MTLEEIIKHDITTIIEVPIIMQGFTNTFHIIGVREVEVVSPYKLAKFLSEHIKPETVITKMKKSKKVVKKNGVTTAWTG